MEIFSKQSCRIFPCARAAPEHFGSPADGALTFALTTASFASRRYDGPAELPRVTVPSAIAKTPAPGSVITVNAGDNLQSALNNAQCGDVIQLQAGATFTGRFTVPAKNCDINHWIWIRTSAPDSALPAEGHRATPCYAGVAALQGRPSYSCPNPQNVMAKVQLPDPGRWSVPVRHRRQLLPLHRSGSDSRRWNAGARLG